MHVTDFIPLSKPAIVVSRACVNSISRSESFKRVSFALNLDGTTWQRETRVMHRPSHFCNGPCKRVLGSAKFGKPPGSRSNLLRMPSPDGQWPPSTWKSYTSLLLVRSNARFVTPIILIFDNQLCYTRVEREKSISYLCQNKVQNSYNINNEKLLPLISKKKNFLIIFSKNFI